ncbi:UNVERIFIED_CONTAM: hypothetical protein FKN15_024557 [Acipenser sinensis]
MSQKRRSCCQLLFPLPPSEELEQALLPVANREEELWPLPPWLEVPGLLATPEFAVLPAGPPEVAVLPAGPPEVPVLLSAAPPEVAVLSAAPPEVAVLSAGPPEVPVLLSAAPPEVAVLSAAPPEVPVFLPAAPEGPVSLLATPEGPVPVVPEDPALVPIVPEGPVLVPVVPEGPVLVPVVPEGRGQQPINIRLSVMAVTRRESPFLLIFFSFATVIPLTAQGPKAQWVSSDPTSQSVSFLHPGTRERMSTGYRPLEDKDPPSKSPPPSSLGAWPVGVTAERQAPVSSEKKSVPWQCLGTTTALREIIVVGGIEGNAAIACTTASNDLGANRMVSSSTTAAAKKKRLETRFLRCYNDVGPSPTKDLWGIIAMSDPVRQWTAKG